MVPCHDICCNSRQLRLWCCSCPIRNSHYGGLYLWQMLFKYYWKQRMVLYSSYDNALITGSDKMPFGPSIIQSQVGRGLEQPGNPAHVRELELWSLRFLTTQAVLCFTVIFDIFIWSEQTDLIRASNALYSFCVSGHFDPHASSSSIFSGLFSSWPCCYNMLFWPEVLLGSHSALGSSFCYHGIAG